MISSTNETSMFINYKLNPQYTWDKFKPEQGLMKGLLKVIINSFMTEVPIIYTGVYMMGTSFMKELITVI